MKPFYYTFDGEKFFFGSEPKYINLLSNKKYKVDSDKITDLILREEKHSHKSSLKIYIKLKEANILFAL